MSDFMVEIPVLEGRNICFEVRIPLTMFDPYIHIACMGRMLSTSKTDATPYTDKLIFSPHQIQRANPIMANLTKDKIIFTFIILDKAWLKPNSFTSQVTGRELSIQRALRCKVTVYYTSEEPTASQCNSSDTSAPGESCTSNILSTNLSFSTIEYDQLQRSTEWYTRHEKLVSDTNTPASDVVLDNYEGNLPVSADWICPILSTNPPRPVYSPSCSMAHVVDFDALKLYFEQREDGDRRRITICPVCEKDIDVNKLQVPEVDKEREARILEARKTRNNAQKTNKRRRVDTQPVQVKDEPHREDAGEPCAAVVPPQYHDWNVVWIDD